MSISTSSKQTKMIKIQILVKCKQQKYLKKKLGASNKRSHCALPNIISSVIAMPLSNSLNITLLFDVDTLNVEFCCGYAGVIIGIKWYRSLAFTLGSQTFKKCKSIESLFLLFLVLTYRKSKVYIVWLF